MAGLHAVGQVQAVLASNVTGLVSQILHVLPSGVSDYSLNELLPLLLIEVEVRHEVAFERWSLRPLRSCKAGHPWAPVSVLYSGSGEMTH